MFFNSIKVADEGHSKKGYKMGTLPLQNCLYNKLCGRPPQYAPPRDLNLLTLKVVPESRVTWTTSVPILVFIGLSVLDLGPMYATNVRCQTAYRL